MADQDVEYKHIQVLAGLVGELSTAVRALIESHPDRSSLEREYKKVLFLSDAQIKTVLGTDQDKLAKPTSKRMREGDFGMRFIPGS